MPTDDRQQLVQLAQNAPAICFASGEEYLLRTAAARLQRSLQAQWEDSEVTLIPGEDFTLEQAVTAAGTISFFAGRRIVRIDRLPVAALDDKTFTEFCDLLHDTESAFFILTVLTKTAKDAKDSNDGKEGKDKKQTQRQQKHLRQLQQLLPAACFLDLKVPNGPALRQLAAGMAEALGAALRPDAAEALLQAVGGDLQLLENEIAKLAAGASYGVITTDTVAALGLHTVEADVFAMVDAITAGRPQQAFAILDRLLYLRTKPVNIVAPIASSFVDMVRVQTAARHRIGYAAVWKELGYTGKSDYRLKRAGQTAARYSPQALQNALEILVRLDSALKSSPIDQNVLLQTALCELCALPRGGRR